jgi:hypothetical protein
VRTAKLQVKHRLLLAQLDRLSLISARDSEFDLLVTGSIEQVDEQGGQLVLRSRNEELLATPVLARLVWFDDVGI